jgi:hypothetical protein
MFGCVATVATQHEDALPEHKRASVGVGLAEAARSYQDAWRGDGDLVVGPMSSLSGSYAPVPEVKLGLAMDGTGLGATGKVVLTHADRWAAAVVETAGFVAGDNTDPFTNVRTWKASGLHTNTSAVLSFGNRRPVHPGRKDILFSVSGGPRAMITWLHYQRTDGTDQWRGTVVDYGLFVGTSFERWFFRTTAELVVLSVDRPTAGTREVHALGGLKLHFSW